MGALEVGVPRTSRADQIRNYRSHPDSIFGQFCPQPFAESDQGELAGRVRQEVRESHFAPNRCDIYDPSLMALFHARKDAQGGVNGTPEVDAHDFLEIAY